MKEEGAKTQETKPDVKEPDNKEQDKKEPSKNGQGTKDNRAAADRATQGSDVTRQ